VLRRAPNAVAAAADRRPDVAAVAAVAAVASGARGADAAAERTRSAPADDERTLAAADGTLAAAAFDERNPPAASLAAVTLAAASERERDDAPGRHVRGASRLVAAPRRYALGAISRRRRFRRDACVRDATDAETDNRGGTRERTREGRAPRLTARRFVFRAHRRRYLF
jgi:hypothetical protein